MTTPWMDQGYNDGWVKPTAFRRLAKGRYALTITEPFGRSWAGEYVSFDLPAPLCQTPLAVTDDDTAVASQVDLSGTRLTILVDALGPHQTREYRVAVTSGAPAAADPSISLTPDGDTWLFTNGHIGLQLPGASTPGTSTPIPGPILAVRRGDGPWLGAGDLDTPIDDVTISDPVLAEAGSLWATVVVGYAFQAGQSSYQMVITMRPGDPLVAIEEVSDLPGNLWPAPRPYREIGSLGKSFWDQPLESVARPCVRPCPSSNFVFSLTGHWQPDRLQTHSTAAWEIMDMPLGSPTLKAYTAMRASYPAVDAGWMSFYQDDDPTGTMVGIASVDLAHWRFPDDLVHPVHRTPGVNAEVPFLDDPDRGPHLRFPIENLSRHWLLMVADRYSPERPEPGRPLRLDGIPEHPLWIARIRRGDLSLDKVKDWVTDWDDSSVHRPRVFCRKADFPAIREKVLRTPELFAKWQETRDWRPADRFMLEGAPATLADVEAITNGRQLVEATLDRGYLGPSYAIGLCRPLRRYALACDILWDCFSPEDRREAKRVLALAAYIMSDGDWWQYAYRPGQTTYLPNFNTDVYACAGIIAMVLGNHPCTEAWVAYTLERTERELEWHLRLDGGGEENSGSYYMSTWQQLYMPLLYALRHTGARDYSADPRIHAGARFILKVFGPPDPRDNWQRQAPPIGHHPHARKAFPVVPQLAAFIRNADPQLAAELTWAWRESGCPVGNLYDHSGPLANPFTRHYVFHDPTIEARPPTLGSYDLPHVGAVFRTHGLSRQGSFMLLKAGRVHSHHDEDEGSFHYFGRGVPLALDGLRLENGAPPREHNQLSFPLYGQPSGHVEVFTSTPGVDYVRAVIPPRGFCNDQMYLLDTHRSGWTRELVMVKADQPGGVEYLVVKDTATGPDAPTWNLDVLSKEPTQDTATRLWFPGHPEFGMGMDLIFVEPFEPAIEIERGPLAKDLKVVAGEATRPAHHVDYEIVEHWLVHVPAGPGATFVTVLFPRSADEQAPVVDYLEREETLIVTHAAGRDMIFLRPNPAVGLQLGGVSFRGRAAAVIDRKPGRQLANLDAEVLEPCVVPGAPG